MTDLSELTAAERKRRAPWDKIKIDVGMGLPWREIARKHGNIVSYETIRREAAKGSWKRNLASRVKDQTDRKVLKASRDAVTKKRVTRGKSSQIELAESPMMEREAIAAAAEQNFEIIQESRGAARDALSLWANEIRMLRVLQDPAIPALLQELLKQVAEGSAIDISESMRAALADKIANGDRRIQTCLRATEGLAKAVEVSYRVYRIDQQVTEDDPWVSVINWITANNKPLVQVGVQVNEPVQCQEWVK